MEEPQGGRYYRQKDYYIVPVKVPHDVYAALVKFFSKEGKIILKAYEQGISQKVVAKSLMASQSYVQKSFRKSWIESSMSV